MMTFFSPLLIYKVYISFAAVAFSLASSFYYYTMVIQSVVHEVIMKDIQVLCFLMYG